MVMDVNGYEIKHIHNGAAGRTSYKVLTPAGEQVGVYRHDGSAHQAANRHFLKNKDTVRKCLCCQTKFTSTGAHPFTRNSWSAAFRRYAADAGIPDNIQAMDTRAGAITDAKLLGADQYQLRDAAGHSQVSTTDRYARSNNENASKVVKLRMGK